MPQQRAFARRTDTSNLLQARLANIFLAARSVRADSKAMRLVTQSLHEIEQRIAWLQFQRRTIRQEEGLVPRVALLALGDTDQRYIRDAKLREGFPCGIELTKAAVDQHQIGPRRRIGGEGIGV